MFDWLFGKKDNSYDQVSKDLEDLNIARSQANQFYNENIAGDNWNKLNAQEKAIANNIYDQIGGAVKGGVDQYGKELEGYNQHVKDNRYNYFGNGLLGTLLNPIGQTVSAGADLLSGNYGKNNRDIASDLGALGETALTVLPFGEVFRGAKGMAALGAGFGGLDTVREQGGDTNFGDVLKNASIGALFGDGLDFAGNKLGDFMRNRGANEIAGKLLSNPNYAEDAKKIMANNGTAALSRNILDNPDIYKEGIGGLYRNGLESLIPRSNVGRLAMGGAGLYGGMRLLSGGQDQQQMYDPYSQQMGGY